MVVHFWTIVHSLAVQLLHWIQCYICNLIIWNSYLYFCLLDKINVILKGSVTAPIVRDQFWHHVIICLFLYDIEDWSFVALREYFYQSLISFMKDCVYSNLFVLVEQVLWSTGYVIWQYVFYFTHLGKFRWPWNYL